MASEPYDFVQAIRNLPLPPPDDGPELLDALEAFLARFIVYPSEAARIAHTLWVAHTWAMDCWESTPRIAFLSPEPGSGKSRALEVTEPLVPRPVHAVNTTPAYLFRKVSDDAGPPTILYDEVDTLFGPRAKDNEDIRGMLNAGHRKGAVAGRCVVKGKLVMTEELPAYCAVALAGLDDLPDTLMTRSVVIRMRRRAPDEQVQPWRHRVNAGEAHALASALERWVDKVWDDLDGRWPTFPDGITDRPADVWEPLLSVAEVAGGDWPERANVSAVTLVTDSLAATPSLGITLLRDLAAIFAVAESDKLPTETLLTELVKVDDSPWADLRGKALDARGLSRRLAKYGVKPKPLRDGAVVFKGYDLADLADAFNRYLTAPTDTMSNLHYVNLEGEVSVGVAGKESVTSVTSVTIGPDDIFAAAGACPACDWPLDSQGHLDRCGP